MIDFDKKIAKIEEQEKALKAQKKAILSAKKNQDIKRNQTRLAKIGEICEGVYGQEITKEQLAKLKAFLMEQESRGKFFSKALS